jgi:hypothetical protein
MCENMPMGKKTVSDDEILEAFSEIQGGFASPIEIADHFGHDRQWAYNRLEQLREAGEVVKKKPSPQAVAYWPAEATYQSFPGDTLSQSA